MKAVFKVFFIRSAIIEAFLFGNSPNVNILLLKKTKNDVRPVNEYQTSSWAQRVRSRFKYEHEYYIIMN